MSLRSRNPRPALTLVATLMLGSVPAGAAIAADDIHEAGVQVLTYRGDAARTGIMPGPGPAGTPAIAWQFWAMQGLSSSPTLQDGTIHIVSAKGMVHGLAIGDGSERWAVDLGADSSATPLIAGGVLVLADESGRVRGLSPSAIDPAEGRELWHTDIGGSVLTSVTMSDGAAYLGASPGTVVALTIADGAERWRRQLVPEGKVLTPSFADGRLYVAIGDAPAGHLWALDAATGEPVWDHGVPDGVTAYMPALAHGRAYVVRTDGIVEALDAASGAVVWSVQTPSSIDAGPSIVDDLLLVAGVGGPVEALDLATGATRWSVPIRGTGWTPIAASGFVLVPTDIGVLYAIGGQAPR
jgi:outer membrane protein assembly factor BamB